MNETRRTHLEATPPLPAILEGIVSVQAGVALAKGLFPALEPIGTVGLRVWPKDIGFWIEATNAAECHPPEQKVEILYNNTARFRLPDAPK